MFQFLKERKSNAVITAVILLVFGAVLLIWPAMSMRVLCTFLGTGLAAGGFFRVLDYIFHRDGSLYFQGSLVLGVVLMALGVWIVLKPESILLLVPVIVGVIVILNGITDIRQCIELYRAGYERWWAVLLVGILTVFLGALLVWNPFTAVNTLVRVIGVLLIYNGISNLWILQKIGRFLKETEKDLS